MKDKKYQHFLSTYKIINSNHKLFKKHAKSKLLTRHEKQILKAVFEYKKENLEDAKEILNAITDGQSAFIQGHKHLVWGMIYNHQGLYNKAAKELVKSYMALSESEYKFIAYRPLNILCMLYFNLKDLTRLKKYHKVFLSIKNETIEHDVLDYNYRIYINILAENHQTALHLIDGLLFKHSEYLNDQKGSYIINKIMIASVIEDFDLCYKLLEEYKSTGGFKLRSNYKYIVSILNYLTKNAPIYAYKRDFENSEYLYQQLCLIKNLELNNHKEAKDNWNYFHTKWPERFGENFVYLSSKDMFSMALDKALKKNQFKNITGSIEFHQSELEQFKALPEKLNYLLSSPNHIFTKDELIKYIWGEKWTPKNDDRLRKLISRTQKKYAIKVQNLDGKYKKVA